MDLTVLSKEGLSRHRSKLKAPSEFSTKEEAVVRAEDVKIDGQLPAELVHLQILYRGIDAEPCVSPG